MKLVTLLLIIALAFLLRFYHLSTNPPALNLDEVAIGYNAYSILRTGRDEYGKFLPVVFRSHDDYKPPLYIYLTVPSIATFGVNEFAVRFPAALLGTLSVLSTFLLVRQLFTRTRLALLASFLLAISPWHLQFTRAAFETGSTVFFTTLGAYLFFHAIESRNSLLFALSALVFGLELYLYQATKVVIPLFIFTLLIVNFKKILNQKKQILGFILVFIIFLFPVIYLSTTVAGQIRFQGTSIFLNNFPYERTIAWRTSDINAATPFFAPLFHPRILAFVPEIVLGYLSHFDLTYLFIGNHGPPNNYVPGGIGLLYFWELPVVLVGLYFLIRRFRSQALIIFAWLLLAPLPASLTTGAPSAIRTMIILPTYQIFTALGIFLIVSRLRNKLLFLSPMLILLTVPLLSFYLHMMFFHAPNAYSNSWFYGYKEVVAQVSKLSPKYNQVIVSTNLKQPQNFFAFFLRYDPGTYINVDGGTVSGGFLENRNHFGSYFFTSNNWNQLLKEPNTLFVGLPKDFPGEIIPIKTFHYLDGKPSVIIFGT